MQKTDDYIEIRLTWKASQYNLPTNFAFYFKDLSSDVQKSISTHIDVITRGRPMLFFTTRSEKWTLICTREILCNDNGELTKLNFRDIKQILPADFAPILTGQSVDVKSIGQKIEWNQITVVDKEDLQHAFYAESGSD